MIQGVAVVACVDMNRLETSEVIVDAIITKVLGNEDKQGRLATMPVYLLPRGSSLFVPCGTIPVTIFIHEGDTKLQKVGATVFSAILDTSLVSGMKPSVKTEVKTSLLRRAALGTNTATSTKLRIKTFVEAFPEDEEPNEDENAEEASESPKAKSLFDFNIFSYKA